MTIADIEVIDGTALWHFPFFFVYLVGALETCVWGCELRASFL